MDGPFGFTPLGHDEPECRQPVNHPFHLWEQEGFAVLWNQRMRYKPAWPSSASDYHDRVVDGANRVNWIVTIISLIISNRIHIATVLYVLII